MKIPKWLKSKKALEKEVKRRFCIAMREEVERKIEEEENHFLYGDPSLKQYPLGIISIRITK